MSWPLTCLEDEAQLNERLKEIKLNTEISNMNENFTNFLELKDNKQFLENINENLKSSA